MRKYFGVALALLLVSCSADETANVVTAAQSPELSIENYHYSSDEMQLADAINKHRTSIGLERLETVNYVSIKSEEHNQYMIANGVVNHDHFEQRAQEIIDVVGATKVHENVAYNFSTASAVLGAWLDSQEHKANIEGDFTHFGFSIRTDPETWKKYYTNIFIKK